MKSIGNCKLVQLKIFSDTRGALVALEQNKNVPFAIKRVYYIFNTKKDSPRGFHAHKNLEQVLICVSGSCKIKVDNGKKAKIFCLSNPKEALYIGKNIWREMFDFSKDCVLLVIASDYYDSSEYIHDYEEFLKKFKVN